MPTIGTGTTTLGKTYAVGFWESQLCDNSLAEFPSGIDFSWGYLQFYLDGLDADNYVDVKIVDSKGNVLKSFNFTTNGKKTIDLSNYSEISSTQDIRVRFELTTLI